MFSRFKLLVVPNYRLHCRTFSQFVNRHIGISENEKKEMLKECNVSSMNKLITEATSIPKEKQKQLYLKSFPNEHSAQNHLYSIMEKNKNVKSYLGQGYYNSILPFPIKRYILENPKWYTAYTPYQAEISQGRLESQYNYQQVIKDLTGMDVSNASLLDEASASAEVINICYQSSKQKKKTFLVSDKIHPQVLEVLKTKTQIFDIQLVYLDYNKVKKYEYENLNIDFNDVCGYMFQYPDTEGNIQIPQQFINFLNENKILVACSSDLLALTQLKSPQEIGASIALEMLNVLAFLCGMVVHILPFLL
jgi:glycine dehydrogenase